MLSAIAALILAVASTHPCSAAAPASVVIDSNDGLPLLRVSDNHRFLVTANGKPFFYLADTAWELFHRLDRDEASRYLVRRARQHFTVVQAVALAELDGLKDPNAYGHRPLIDNDPTHPDVKDGPDNDYWDHVDYVVAEANRRGLYVGFLPTWGDKWHQANWEGGPPVFTPASAETYGRWLGQRYRNAGLIWILGGDRPVSTDRHREILAALARGLRHGDGGRHLITFHPPGGNGSSTWFQDADWLDFNFRQNGHTAEYTGHYDKTHEDYLRSPPKPVIDGEPIYEDHPVSFKARELGHSIAADVRRPLYWDLFGGACGHTYGNHAVWQMYDPNRGRAINQPLLPWFEAVTQPGAGQMQYARALFESRPFLTRIPDDSIIVTDRVATSVPGAGRYRFVGTRDTDGTYAMVYAPIGRTFSVRLEAIKGDRIKAWWFNPRDGSSKSAGNFRHHGVQAFLSPDPGEELDWILVLDDASRNYPAPGSRRWP